MRNMSIRSENFTNLHFAEFLINSGVAMHGAWGLSNPFRNHSLYLGKTSMGLGCTGRCMSDSRLFLHIKQK